MACVGLGAAFAVALSGAPSRAATSDPGVVLTARSDEVGRITLAVNDPAATAVQFAEQVGGHATALGRITLTAGAGELRRAATWRCDRRTRTFTATSEPGGATTRATITTPSCAHRLQMIVVPAQVRPGQTATVHVRDGWHLGGISVRLCARSPGAKTRCRTVRPPAARPTVAHVPLGHAGRWTIALRSAEGQTIARSVDATAKARLRLLVTGDSMTYGVFETLGYVLGSRAVVRGDPNPATGISKPSAFDWPAHARSIARSAKADVTVVFLGAADGGFALTTPAGGAPVACCGPAWSAEYARRVAGMMRDFLRGGHGLVYWVILPTPSTANRAVVFDAINAAIRLAASSFDDGVTTIDRIARIVAPGGVFHTSIDYKGKRRVVRVADGVHLAPAGIHIAMSTVLQQLRADGLLH